MIRGKRITKSTINSHKGNVPVYSSSKDEGSVMGFIDKDFLIAEKLRYCTEKSVLFNLDGSVGYCFIRDAKEFSFIDVVA
ncbi:restriction endonuclease subunit S [Isorropodon fossajaponicum symbiont]|uniref:restriction endonuclease subunit S n=1 Tax=Isorropodon fossajaponicum symbiont TaxID=883811 RepID=UPI001914FBE8|nr:restriction endonuclease subunit S [Isorropodon fossajaponicum symbiont]